MRRQVGKQVPSLVYVHELNVARAVLAPNSTRWGLPPLSGDALLACSTAVAQSLRQDHVDTAASIAKLNYFFLTPPSATVSHQTSAGAKALFADLRPEVILVGAIGAPDWRKGFDLFLLLAKMLEADRRYHFAWLGKLDGTRTNLEFEIDLNNMELLNFSWIPYQSSSEDFLRRCDIFAMTSREDPFPLVNLEAMAMGKPSCLF